MKSTAVLAAALSLSLLGGAALAQGAGDTVRIETAKETIEGVLIDRLPNGYLVNKGKASVVVPYVAVKHITKLAPAPLAPMTVPPAAPAKGPSKDAAKASPAATETFQGLAVDPAPVQGTPAGAPVPPPPPVPPPAPAPALAPVPPPPPPPPTGLSPVMVPVPALPAAHKPLAPVRYERRSKIVMGTGIVFVGLGVLAAVTGTVLALEGETQSAQKCEYYASGKRCYDNPDRQLHIDAGRVTLLSGIGAALIGIPIWSIGAKKVPVKEPAKTAELSAVPGGGALTLRF